jgi:hypothetical protein
MRSMVEGGGHLQRPSLAPSTAFGGPPPRFAGEDPVAPQIDSDAGVKKWPGAMSRS